MDCKRVLLQESDLPAAWYNVAADLPEAIPPLLHPGTGEPIDPRDLLPLFAGPLIEQETSRERWIPIPAEVRRKYAIWRPTPLVRARDLECALRTPARIYFKDESRSPPGSHKANTAVPQAYYNRNQGVRRLTTETGAGQWGCSLAMACSLFGLQCKVFMVRLSYQRRPYRRTMMRLWGGEVVPSPSRDTPSGRRILAETPDCPGTIGGAISEAIEAARACDQTRYAMGSVLNHVMVHQSVIGLEVERQLALLGEKPDVVIGCVGGGSNFAGVAFPLLPRRLGGEQIRFIAGEPAACPTMSRGEYRYDFGDTSQQTPLLKMLTLGHDFAPPAIEAGGLRYHGMAPSVSLAARLGLVETRGIGQRESFEAARLFAATEGIIPALETAHAIGAVIEEAVRCRRTGSSECIVFCHSGHGLCDLGSYERYLDGQIDGVRFDDALVRPG